MPCSTCVITSNLLLCLQSCSVSECLYLDSRTSEHLSQPRFTPSRPIICLQPYLAQLRRWLVTDPVPYHQTIEISGIDLAVIEDLAAALVAALVAAPLAAAAAGLRPGGAHLVDMSLSMHT